MIKEYADENNHIYLDYFSAMADDRNGLPKKYASDEVHPTPEGYAVMEPMVEKAIAEAFKSGNKTMKNIFLFFLVGSICCGQQSMSEQPFPVIGLCIGAPSPERLEDFETFIEKWVGTPRGEHLGGTYRFQLWVRDEARITRR